MSIKLKRSDEEMRWTASKMTIGHWSIQTGSMSLPSRKTESISLNVSTVMDWMSWSGRYLPV